MNKHVVISGVSKGIGRALTLELLKLGHCITGCARNVASIEELNDLAGNKGYFEVIDVVDSEAVQQWAGKSIGKFGPADLLINNAALINQNAYFVDVPEEEFDQVIDVNIKGVANVSRAFMSSMIERGSGVIVNLSSGWGRSTSPEVAPYCATKWAIEGLTKAIAQELPPGMAAIPLSPNTVNTEMLQSCFGNEGASHSPTPEEWARVVAPWIIELGPSESGKSLSTPI